VTTGEERLLSAGFIALAGTAIALSLSRSGWIAFGAVMVLVSLFSRHRWAVLAGVVLLAGAAFASLGTVRERVLVEFEPSSDKNTIRLRMALWRSATNLLAHRPLQGGGLSGFKSSVQSYRDPAYMEQLIYPHNIVLNFWSETGLLGLAGFGWLFVAALVACRRALAAGPWPRPGGDRGARDACRLSAPRIDRRALFQERPGAGVLGPDRYSAGGVVDCQAG